MARGLTRRASLGLLGALATPWLARAQSDYPNRIIKLIVPYAAGGSSDVVARFIAERMRERLGQSIIIENRPGAGAIVGSQFVARSLSDGYTLLLGGVSTHAVNPHLRKLAPYDGINDFTSLGLIGTGPLVVSVNPGLPVNSLQELIAYGKANPTKLAYGSATGVILHLAGELLKTMAGFEMLHVPYGGNGPALTDVLGGRLQVMVDAVGNSAPYIADGKLAPWSSHRSSVRRCCRTCRVRPRQACPTIKSKHGSRCTVRRRCRTKPSARSTPHSMPCCESPMRWLSSPRSASSRGRRVQLRPLRCSR